MNTDHCPARHAAHDVAVVDDTRPVADPGLEEHVERWTDVNPSAGNRAYRQVLGMLALVPLLSIIFVVIYFAVPRDMEVRFLGWHSNAMHVGLGLTAGLAILLIGLACIHWAKQLMSDVEMVEERHDANSSPEERKEFLAAFQAGADDSALGRRKLIGGALGGALGIIAIPAVVTLADMGPHPGPGTRRATIEKTIWAEGVHLVNDVTYARLKASDLEVGSLVNAEPETLKELEGAHLHIEKAKAAIVIVRMEPDSIKIPDSRRDWQVGGILAYSKICTHVGCPISLWERQTHHLLCPCHQSTFDLADSGVVVFGPAARALPQLPIAVDADGYLVAKSDFTVPVGPSYFERDSRDDFKKGDN
ncbi:cytochrome bc1 complex Rieske iron-sulfur subunit [Aestuariimicrobium ganziense]|uniref:cytochrome bc1 complex Rieske iron-sulfur subunit n=1 Tax=Aestuariimicrobium ganziense TaxID=2773677 RepID=UPI001942C1B7|nr:Rieske 2Fe-2S domain-containing protein [Aestuariimicrobium ganziense]